MCYIRFLAHFSITVIKYCSIFVGSPLSLPTLGAPGCSALVVGRGDTETHTGMKQVEESRWYASVGLYCYKQRQWKNRPSMCSSVGSQCNSL